MKKKVVAKLVNKAIDNVNEKYDRKLLKAFVSQQRAGLTELDKKDIELFLKIKYSEKK